jgi:LmbE family N-acetylglucosaminyl deacetylase
MPSVLALFAHPDDIEFHASGTLLQLGRRGWNLHYCNLSNGNLGSTKTSPIKTATIRRAEARKSAQILGATWHPSFCNDFQVFYTDKNIRRVCALIRTVQPTILLTHPAEDYMEDHMVTCKLAVSGAFARGVPFYKSKPNKPATLQPVTIYHSMPRGHQTPDRRPVHPDAYVNVASVHEQRKTALSAHQSQKEWLDLTQGTGSFLELLDHDSLELGRRSKKFKLAEGWHRHSHIGFCEPNDDPLRDALDKDWCAANGRRSSFTASKQ